MKYHWCLATAFAFTLAGTHVSMLSFGGEPIAPSEPDVARLWVAYQQSDPLADRLTDFSYAGYHRGERPLPESGTPVLNVKDFGAVGDGATDDTAAFHRAIREGRGKRIKIPAGKYIITDILEVRESGTVLEGDGPDRTVLFVPKPLEEIRSNLGETTEGRPTSNYSWSGGIIMVHGRWSQTRLAAVTADAKRGDSALQVDSTVRVQKGDLIRLTMEDDDHESMVSHLYAGNPGNTSMLRRVTTSWIARIVSIDHQSKTVRLDRKLTTDVRSAWQPLLFPAESSTQEVGIEHLAFEFPITPYEGHFTELGYNAIALGQVQNCWVRDIEIRHADSGIFVSGANNTLREITFLSDRSRDKARNSTGHHGVTLGGLDSLLSNFRYHTKFIHDITVSRGSSGNVVREGQAEDLTFDHHKYANHANLYTNIDAGEGTDIFRSGGGTNLGRHCGAWTTWWNVRTQRPVAFPVDWATDVISIVGVRAKSTALDQSNGRWLEPMPNGVAQPLDLYQTQLQIRLSERF